MKHISIVISAYNEEKKIARCLESVSWADEIIVVDNESNDKTASVAKAMKAKVFSRPNNSMLNENKNYGFTKATSDWILSLDADEVVPPDLAKEVIQVVRNASSVDGYWLARKNIIFGKWIQYGLWWPDKQLRLFRRGKGTFPCKHVHEYLVVDGPTGDLQESFFHYNYETISQYIHKLDAVYTVNEVETMRAAGYEITWADAIKFPVSDFVKIFFAQKGYRDGLHGLVLSLLQAFYSFVVFAKLWEAQGFPQKDVTIEAISRQMDLTTAEVHYWNTTTRIQESKNWFGTLWLRIQRKFLYDRKN